MRLGDIKAGDNAKIISLDFTPLVKKRFRDLGFGEGDNVECVRLAALSSPILYFSKGAYVALRRSDANKIGVAHEQ